MAGKPPFDQFDTESEDVESYLERIKEYFTAYDIVDDKDNAAKWWAISLTSIENNSFRVQKDLAFPDAPNTKTFAHLATLLHEHFKAACLRIAEILFPFCSSAVKAVHRWLCQRIEENSWNM